MSADASNYDLQNLECQSLIPSCKISSRWPRFAKKAITNLSDVLRRHLCLQQLAPACGLTHGCVTMQHSQCMQMRMILEQWWTLIVCYYDNRSDV